MCTKDSRSKIVPIAVADNTLCANLIPIVRIIRGQTHLYDPYRSYRLYGYLFVHMPRTTTREQSNIYPKCDLFPTFQLLIAVNSQWGLEKKKKKKTVGKTKLAVHFSPLFFLLPHGDYCRMRTLIDKKKKKVYALLLFPDDASRIKRGFLTLTDYEIQKARCACVRTVTTSRLTVSHRVMCLIS